MFRKQSRHKEEQEDKNPKQHKEGLRRTPWSRQKRLAALAAGAAAVAAGGIWTILEMRPREETVSQELYSYQVTADSAYQVHLLPNDLYEGEWMEEGGVYAELLTDYIQIDLNAGLSGSQEAEITGSYQVDAVVQGFQTAEETKTVIYSKRESLSQGEIHQEDPVSAQIQEQVVIRPAVYRQQTLQAEQILGTSTAKEFFLEFKGIFYVQTQAGTEEKEFSYQLNIPLGSGTSLYQIQKPDPLAETGAITEDQTVRTSPDSGKLIPGAAAGAGGLALLLFTALCTRLPNEEERWRMKIDQIFRRYGSRMIRLNGPKGPEEGERIRLADMDSLLLLAEELHQPICLYPDSEGRPEGGEFFILEQEKRWCFICEKTGSVSEQKEVDESSIDHKTECEKK